MGLKRFIIMLAALVSGVASFAFPGEQIVTWKHSAEHTLPGRPGHGPAVVGGVWHVGEGGAPDLGLSRQAVEDGEIEQVF